MGNNHEKEFHGNNFSRRRFLIGSLYSIFLGSLGFSVGRGTEDKNTREHKNLVGELLTQYRESFNQTLTEASFTIPENMDSQKKIEMAKSIFFAQKNLLFLLFDKLLNHNISVSQGINEQDNNFYGYSDKFIPAINNNVGLLNLLSRASDEMPVFKNDTGISPHHPSAVFFYYRENEFGDSHEIEINEENASEYGIDLEKMRKRFMDIATLFPHSGNLGLYRIKLSEKFYASANKLAPDLSLNINLAEPVAFLHEIFHTLEGAYLHEGFLQYADEANYYLYLSERIKAIYDVISFWIDQCSNDSYKMLMKDGNVLFSYHLVFYDGIKDESDFYEELNQLFNQQGLQKYKARASQIINNSSKDYYKGTTDYDFLNVAWNLYLSDCFTGKAELARPHIILARLLNELDHYFIGPVQKDGGGLPTNFSELSLNQLSKANIRVNSAFLRFFHKNPSITPFSLGQSFGLDNF